MRMFEIREIKSDHSGIESDGEEEWHDWGFIR